ncbi:MAG: hypothetical protein N838_14255 [Thiohalocapsa sp. PB-PSB1]|jgi:hypothetical protein|nr:MAG: hypothetical protein N838_14255 [Thiohalocapsa sp. PB-PSB1]
MFAGGMFAGGMFAGQMFAGRYLKEYGEIKLHSGRIAE